MNFNKQDKLHYKMYKSGKKWIIASVFTVTAGTSILFINNIANADVVQTNSNINSSISNNNVSSLSNSNEINSNSNTNSNDSNSINSSSAAKDSNSSNASSAAKDSNSSNASSAAKDSNSSNASSAAKDSNSSNASSAAKDSNSSNASSAAKDSNSSNASSAAKDSNISNASSAAKDSNSSNASSAAKDSNSSNASSAAKDSNSSNASSAAKDSNSSNASSAAKDSNSSNASSAAKDSNSSDASSAAKDSNSSDASSAAEDSNNSSYSVYLENQIADNPHIKKVDGNYHYYNSDGTIQKNTLVKLSNNAFVYFDKDGNYVNLNNNLQQTDVESINNLFTQHNAAYSNDTNSITTTDGFLTANSWYRPKDILKDGTTWSPSTDQDFRPILMTWWPDKSTQVNYLNYMKSNDLGNNNYTNSDDLNTLTDGSEQVQAQIEKKITDNNGNTDWLHTLMNNFVNSQSIWNMNSEGHVTPSSSNLQGGFLTYNNSPLTPDANSNYRLLNKGGWGVEFLLASDVDNSNPVVQAETLNWLHYMLNTGSIINNDPSANFDSVRLDAIGQLDSDILNLTTNYLNDAYGIKQNDANANAHLSILESEPHYPNNNQLVIDYGTKDYIINSFSGLPGSRETLEDILKNGLVNRRNDSGENQTVPNYTYVHAHDDGVQVRLGKIISDKLGSDAGLQASKDQYDEALKYYEDDINSTNKQYTFYNVPSMYALMLTNKDTVPRVYYGDLYDESQQYMQQQSIYYNAISSMLEARTKYVSGGQSMGTSDNGNILTSVRYGKGANTSSDIGDSITRTSGMAVITSNNPNLQDTSVTINMGAAHKSQAYRPLLLTNNDGIQSFNSDDVNGNVIYTDENGNLTLSSSLVHGYSNPQVSGYLSVWVPKGANDNQDVRTAPSTTDHNDGNALHSNAALDSNVIFESFSSFQPQATSADKTLTAVLAQQAENLKKLGFTSIEFPPLYKSSNGTSFLDEALQNGYAFSDRYNLGIDSATKYGTFDQLSEAVKSVHQQGMQAMTDIVANQLYGLNGDEVVSATRTDWWGNPTNTTTINDDLYSAKSIGGGEYQKRYGGEFLDMLQQKYPDLFTTKQASTGKTIDPSVKIKQWSAKYLNGSSIQGRGADYVLRNNGNTQYFTVGSNVNLPNQLLGKNVEVGFINDNGNVSYYTLSGQKIIDSLALINNKLYYFDKNGNMTTGIHYNGVDYVFLPNGGLLTSSFYLDNNGLHYSNDKGYLVTNEFIEQTPSSNNYYYFGSAGIPLTGKQIINGKIHFFNSNGIQAKNAAVIDSNNKITFYDVDNGLPMKTETLDSKVVNYDNNGNIVAPNEFVRAPINNGRDIYYLNSDNEILKGFNEINGSKYYFDNNGVMLISGYIKDDNGITYQASADGKLSIDTSNNTSINNNSNNLPYIPSTNIPSNNVQIGESYVPSVTTNSSSSNSVSLSSSSSVSSSSSSASSASSSASSSSVTSSASSVDGGSNANSAGDSNKAKDAMIKAQSAVKVAEKLKNQTHSKAHVKNYNKALDNYYQAEKHYLKVAKLHNSKYYYDFDKVTKHSKYVKLSKSAYVYDSKKFNKENRVSKVKKGTKVKVNKIVRHGKTTRFNIGHNKFITGLKSFIHKLIK